MAGPETSSSTKTRGSIGRPKAEVVRDHYITVRVTAAEHFKVLDKARRAGVSVTDFARDRVLRGIARKRKTIASAAEEVWLDDVMPLVRAVREVWHELHKLCINVNQIARHCNRHQVPPPAEYAEVLAMLLALLQRLTRP
jgi:hypothetical protein